jgi:Uncharacterised nucleotidyltransferase
MITELDEMYSPRLGREVELHWKLWDEDKTGIRLDMPNDFLSRRQLRDWEGLRFWSLASDDGLIYQAAHTLRHILEGWCRLSSLYEIAYFLRRHTDDRIFWNALRNRLGANLLLCQVIGVTFGLALALFDLSIADQLRTWTVDACTPEMALWVERYGRDLALTNFCANKSALLLHREFVESPAKWRDVRRRRVFLLKWPSRVGEVPSPASSRVDATRQQLAYLLKLLRFHLPASARYLWELTRWRRSLRAAKREQARPG